MLVDCENECLWMECALSIKCCQLATKLHYGDVALYSIDLVIELQINQPHCFTWDSAIVALRGHSHTSLQSHWLFNYNGSPTVDFVELWIVFYEYCSLLGRSSNMGSWISTDHRYLKDFLISCLAFELYSFYCVHITIHVYVFMIETHPHKFLLHFLYQEWIWKSSSQFVLSLYLDWRYRIWVNSVASLHPCRSPVLLCQLYYQKWNINFANGFFLKGLAFLWGKQSQTNLVHLQLLIPLVW